MPRNISPGLLAHIQKDGIAWAIGVLIQRTDGVFLAFTSWDVSITPAFPGGLDPLNVSGHTYSHVASLTPVSFKQGTDLSVDGFEATVIVSDDYISEADIQARVYDMAKYVAFQFDPQNISSGYLVITSGYMGELNQAENSFTTEFNSKMNLLNQPVIEACSMNCRVKQLGDFQCKIALGPYQNNNTLSSTGVSVASVASVALQQINCGAGAVSPFIADADFSGGNTLTTTNVCIPPIANAAPAAVYQSYRYGNFTYTLTGLTPNTEYIVRLHFAESHFVPPLGHPQQSQSGKRQFDVTLNGILGLSYFDVWAVAGGSNVGISTDLETVANGSGHIAVVFSSHPNLDNPMCSGIEVITPTLPAITNGLEFNGDANVDGYYTNGRAVFGLTSSNPNWVGDIMIHRVSSGNAVIFLWEDPPNPVNIGDAVMLEAGCDRRPVTCTHKFNNMINIDAEPDTPGNQALLRTGRSAT